MVRNEKGKAIAACVLQSRVKPGAAKLAHFQETWHLWDSGLLCPGLSLFLQVWFSCVTLTSAVSHPKYHSGVMVSFRSTSKLPTGQPSAAVCVCAWASAPCFSEGQTLTPVPATGWLVLGLPPLYLLPFPSPHLLTAAKSLYFPQRGGCRLCFTLGHPQAESSGRYAPNTLQSRELSRPLGERQGESGMGDQERGEAPKRASG